MARILEHPGLRAFCDAIEAYENGDESLFWELVERRLGRKPDSLTRGRLKSDELPLGEDLPLTLLSEVLHHHKLRLKKREETSRVPKQNAEVRRGIKRFESLDLALDRLAVQGQTHEEVLTREIPGAAYIEGYRRPGLVANRIRRDGMERPDKPGLVSATGDVSEPSSDIKSSGTKKLRSEKTKAVIVHRDDGAELEEFIVREDTLTDLREAGCSPNEVQVFYLAVYLEMRHKEIAVVLGRDENQVKQEMHRAREKMRRKVA